MTVTEMKHQARLVEWKEKIMECRSSGVSVKQWCSENNVSDVAYYRWEREIFGRSNRQDGLNAAVSEPVFAELPPPNQNPSINISEPSHLIATLRFEKGELKIYSGADPEVVKTLCSALKLC